MHIEATHYSGDLQQGIISFSRKSIDNYKAQHRHRHTRVARSRDDFDPDLRILLAEDNLVNQKLTLYILERAGLRADKVSNGVEVLGALDRQVYDIVLMDVQMPKLDGVETTKRIRKQIRYGNKPYIIALTASSMPDDRAICLAAGMNDYVSKPFRAAKLLEALKIAQSVCRGV